MSNARALIALFVAFLAGCDGAEESSPSARTPPGLDDHRHIPPFLDDDGGPDVGNPAFSITANPDPLRIPQGGGTRVYFTVTRTVDFIEPIRVTMVGLPEGVIVNTVTLDAAESAGSLTVFAPTTVGVPLPDEARVRGFSGSGTRSAALHVTVRGEPGSVDTSFGDDGFAVVPGMSSLTDVVETEHGTLLVAGGDESGVMTVVRLRKSGPVDETFGVGGRAYVPAARSSTRLAIVDDGIYIAGNDADWNVVVAKLTASGQLDSAFGIAGTSTLPMPRIQLRDFIEVAEGFVLAGGDEASGYLAKISSDGSIAPAFGISGVAAFWGIGQRVIMLADGRLAVVSPSHVHAFTESGVADETFGTGGSATVPDATLKALTLDGHDILAATDEMAIARFGGTGDLQSVSSPLDVGESHVTTTYDIRVDRAGSVVLAGQSSREDLCIGIGRFTDATIPDRRFGESGVSRLCRGDGVSAYELEVLRDGRYVLAGQRYPGDSLVVRVWD